MNDTNILLRRDEPKLHSSKSIAQKRWFCLGVWFLGIGVLATCAAGYLIFMRCSDDSCITKISELKTELENMKKINNELERKIVQVSSQQFDNLHKKLGELSKSQLIFNQTKKALNECKSSLAKTKMKTSNQALTISRLRKIRNLMSKTCVEINENK